MPLPEKYLEYISAVRRYSSRTTEIYAGVLEDFIAYAFPEAADPGRVTDGALKEALTPQMIRNYEAHLLGEKSRNPRTVNLHISVLSGFCRFLMKKGILTSNPAKTVARPKQEKRLPEFYRKDMMAGYFARSDIFAGEDTVPSPEGFLQKYLQARSRPGYRPENDRVFSEMARLADKPEKLAPLSELLRKGPNTVLKVEKKEVKQKPKPPFITSSMQQDAYNKLGFPSQKTMMTAQHLYEGIDVQGQTVGLITYMRTDSFNVSKLLQEQTKKFIGEKYGPAFVPAKQPVYKSKVMGAQEAHESIHPTDVRRTPQAMKPFLTSDQYKLYELIWLRFVASQMADAVFNTVAIDIASGSKEQCVLRASGRTVKFPGYLSIYKDQEEDSSEEKEDGSALLPILAEGDELKLLDIKTKDHKTTPPPCYNEASLIKTLEKHGIGRPSTYAPTIKTILDRKYIARQPKTSKLVATDLGITVTDSLKDFFKEIMDLSYTAGVEEQLDQVAEGNQQWVKLLSDFYTNFKKELDEAEQGMQRPAAKETDEKCPICGKMMLKKRSRFGEYLVCSDPQCKGKINLTSSGEKVQPEKTDEICDKCGAPMVIRTGRRGKFLACSAYPKCKNTYSLDAQGHKVASTGPIITDRLCEKCGKPMVLRTSKRGEFLGCSGYPKCKTIVTVTPEEIEQIKAAHAAKTAAEAKK